MKFTRYLPAFFTLTALCASSRSNTPAGGFLHEVYPKIIDCSDSANVNVYGSAAFRTRYLRFINELADSLRHVEHSLPDTGGEKRAKRAVLSFHIDNAGKVYDVAVDSTDSSDTALKEALQARLLSWRFAFSPSFPLKVIQDVCITGRNQPGFFGRHRFAVIISLIALAVLFY